MPSDSQTLWRPGYMACMALVMMAATGGTAWAQTDKDRFEASLRSGEFATALQIANSQPDRVRRAAQLSRIASIQAAIGERGAMIHTLAQQSSLPAASLSAATAPPNGLLGSAGGGTLADFDPLIELITSTVEPDTWSDVGGPGAIDAFAGGVFVDTEGLMRRARATVAAGSAAATVQAPLDGDPNLQGLKMVSLPRWERAVFRELAMGRPVPRHLRSSGIEHVAYVLAYPEQRDLVLAGPACPNHVDGICLSDIAVIWHAIRTGVQEFGCSIDPLPQNLVRAQRFLETTSGRSIKPAERRRWLAGLREAVAQQEVRVFGLHADVATACTLVEADYHMKLVGIGLEPAPRGVVSYLQSVKLNADGSLPPLELLRWWFTLNDQPIEVGDNHLSFRLPEQTVRLQSENELVDMQGVRRGTGASSPASSAFAESFTEHFLELAKQYPVFARLRSLFDITFAFATIEANDLLNQVDWQPTLLVDPTSPLVRTGHNADRVETVINYRVLARRHIVAAVSGGVVVRPQASTLRVVPARQSADLQQTHRQAAPVSDGLRWSWKRSS